ncbi:hypothetical protein EZS27_019972, partial [termite gut metagenome]
MFLTNMESNACLVYATSVTL